MVKRKSSLRIKKTRIALEIWRTHYDDFGKILKKQLEYIIKK